MAHFNPNPMMSALLPGCKTTWCVNGPLGLGEHGNLFNNVK